MITEEEFKKLKDDAREKRSQADKAEGVLSQLMSDLKEEYGCSTLQEGTTLLEKLEKELEKAEAEFKESYDKYLADYPEED